MSNIEKLSEAVAFRISQNINNEDKDKEEVLAYGAFVLIQTMLTISFITLFGIIFNVLIEVLIISFVASILKKSSGGAHASSPMSCAIISVIIFGGFGLIVNNLIVHFDYIYVILSVFVSFVFTYFIMLKFCPVETVTKPIRSDNKRKRLRKTSLRSVHILLIISVLCIPFSIYFNRTLFYTIILCISLGVAWQSITMVSLGHIIIDGIDKVLVGTNKLLRRIN